MSYIKRYFARRIYWKVACVDVGICLRSFQLAIMLWRITLPAKVGCIKCSKYSRCVYLHLNNKVLSDADRFFPR